MVPNEPGFEETEVLGPDPSVDASLESNPSEANTSAAETQATDVSEPTAAADTLVSEPVSAPTPAPVSAETPPTEVTEPVSAPAPAPVSASSSTLKRGDLVEGTILSTSPTLITVDIGAQQQGIIPGNE